MNPIIQDIPILELLLMITEENVIVLLSKGMRTFILIDDFSTRRAQQLSFHNTNGEMVSGFVGQNYKWPQSHTRSRKWRIMGCQLLPHRATVAAIGSNTTRIEDTNRIKPPLKFGAGVVCTK
uniref:Uncharacterized protein n=1 Tax=Tanacetum cinerariifolium TaxID=118510 RepID=A0A699IH95_TANCI|nr:hypothetical protein [Tanacetum cinerariifolium]